MVPVHGGATYDDVLPSLNLVFDLTRRPDSALRPGQDHGAATHGRHARRCRPAATHALVAGALRKSAGPRPMDGGRRRQARTQALARRLDRPFAGEVLPETQLRGRRWILQGPEELHLRARIRAGLQRLPQLQPGPHARLRAVRAGLRSEHRHDHHAGQWQRRLGLRHRVVDLPGRQPVHARAGRHRRDPELFENGKQPARTTKTATRSTSTASPATSTASGRTSRGAVSRPGSTSGTARRLRPPRAA